MGVATLFDILKTGYILRKYLKQSHRLRRGKFDKPEAYVSFNASSQMVFCRFSEIVILYESGGLVKTAMYSRS